MSLSGSLPPHLAEFIREQLETGHFRSEGEVIRTALSVLEGQVRSQDATAAWLKQEIDLGVTSRPSEPVSREFWDRLRNRVRADTGPGDGD